MQYFCMPTIANVSSRGTLTLPIHLRRKLGLTKTSHAIVLLEERPDGVLLHPAIPVAIRDLPPAKIREWIAQDEADAAAVKLVKRHQGT